jgi:hypothetical protein
VNRHDILGSIPVSEADAGLTREVLTRRWNSTASSPKVSTRFTGLSRLLMVPRASVPAHPRSPAWTVVQQDPWR